MRLFAADMAASLLISLIGIIYPMITRRMLNDLIPNREYRLIVIFGIGLLGVYVIRMLLNYFVQYYGHMMGTQMQAQMRRDMFAHMEKLPLQYFEVYLEDKSRYICRILFFSTGCRLYGAISIIGSRTNYTFCISSCGIVRFSVSMTRSS